MSMPTDGAGAAEHDHDQDHHVPSLSRRTLLGGLGAGAMGLFLPALGMATVRPSRSPLVAVVNAQVRNRYTLAMHVHSSFSEGAGSMHAALTEAARTGMDVVYFTDHDWRRQAVAYRSVVHFTSLTGELERGKPWSWRQRTEGSVGSPNGTIVTTPSSPNDPTPGALRLQVTGPASGTGWLLYDADDSQSRQNLKANVIGHRLDIDVRVFRPSPDSWLELRLSLSYFPPLGGQPASQRQLVYRFGTQTGTERIGRVGIVWQPIPTDTWVTATLQPFDDIVRLFPELPVPGDNSINGLTVGAGARNGATTEGWFDYLRFTRTSSGPAGYGVQQQLLAEYAGIFPTVRSRFGDEISFVDPHVSWLTSTPNAIDHSWATTLQTLPPPGWQAAIRDAIHAGGGLAQYNHPFGSNESNPSGQDQAALLRRAAGDLLGPLGNAIDLVEIGYRSRGGATLATHLALLDVLARNGRFMTATGTTDDHSGTVGSWSQRNNRFATGTWAASLGDGDIRQALLQGQAWCGEVGSWMNALDVTVDGNPMGSVSVRPDLATRMVEVVCPQPPAGGSVSFIRGVVDYAGMADLTALTTTFATATADQLAVGPVQRAVDTSSPCFVRVIVLDAAARVVGFSNPIWLLRADPPGGIPAPRLAPDAGGPPPTIVSTTTTPTTTTPTTTTTTVPGPNTEPNTTVTTPARGATVSAPVAFTGTATDDRGVTAVRYAIRNEVTRLWLQPGGTFGAFTQFNATLSSPGTTTTAWSASVNLAAGSYAVSVRATDSNGTVESTDAWVLFTVR